MNGRPASAGRVCVGDLMISLEIAQQVAPIVCAAVAVLVAIAQLIGWMRRKSNIRAQQVRDIPTIHVAHIDAVHFTFVLGGLRGAEDRAGSATLPAPMPPSPARSSERA